MGRQSLLLIMRRRYHVLEPKEEAAARGTGSGDGCLGMRSGKLCGLDEKKLLLGKPSCMPVVRHKDDERRTDACGFVKLIRIVLHKAFLNRRLFLLRLKAAGQAAAFGQLLGFVA